MKSTHFAVFENNLVIHSDHLISRYFIVLKHPDDSMEFTDFHQYIYSPHHRVRRIYSNDRNRFYSVCQLLNYAFFSAGIRKLSELTIPHVQNFLNAYGMCELDEDDDTTIRNSDTVKRTCRYIIDFVEILIFCKVIKAKKEELYHTVTRRDKRGKCIKVKEPVFQVNYLDSNKLPVYRDIPDAAFRMIFHKIATDHTELLGVVSLCAFAGLRPSEACNVRRVDSSLGPGMIFSYYQGEIDFIEIDLSYEHILRSDLKSVGRIKKERHQNVPELFLDSFAKSYEIYMKYLDGKPYEKAYGPLSLNKQGKALTYASFRQKFQQIIHEEMIPIFLSSEDPQLIRYGKTLLERKLSVHIFRHWYTVQLVLHGVNSVGELMTYRGDKSKESALTYLNDKGDLAKMYKRVNSNVFEYLMWESERRDCP